MGNLPLEPYRNRVSFSPSRASIPGIYQKCDHFQAFVGASPKYLGERVEGSDEEER
jgi:hypothetical protein